MKKLFVIAVSALCLCAPVANAQSTIITDPIPGAIHSSATNNQDGTLLGFFGGGTPTNGIFASSYKGASDALSFVEGVTNGFARVTLEGYYLKTKNQGDGGGANFFIPLSGTNNILGAGFGIGYLNHAWYDATLNARLGDSIPLPMGLQKYFPLYAYIESGGGYNFATKAAIAQAFTGASLHYSLFRTAKGNTFDVTAGYAIGTISDITGNVQAFGGSFTWTF
jgi:hypothetical protein